MKCDFCKKELESYKLNYFGHKTWRKPFFKDYYICDKCYKRILLELEAEIKKVIKNIRIELDLEDN